MLWHTFTASWLASRPRPLIIGEINSAIAKINDWNPLQSPLVRNVSYLLVVVVAGTDCKSSGLVNSVRLCVPDGPVMHSLEHLQSEKVGVDHLMHQHVEQVVL
eukprot:XP_001706335.1 Hypothetical protein GL50803_115501 [Giardia lamblia ATCC 50803]